MERNVYENKLSIIQTEEGFILVEENNHHAQPTKSQFVAFPPIDALPVGQALKLHVKSHWEITLQVDPNQRWESSIRKAGSAIELDQNDNNDDLHIAPLSDFVFTRCDAAAMRQRAGQPNPDHELAELGLLVQRWRLQQGKTRRECAPMLGLSVDQLLCLETGIATREDVGGEAKSYLFSVIRDFLPQESLQIQ